MNRRMRWQQLRRLGKWSYVVRYGVIAWALPVAVVGLLLLTLSTRQLPSLGFILVMLLFMAPLFGTLFGLWTWHENERRFHRANEPPPNEEGMG